MSWFDDAHELDLLPFFVITAAIGIALWVIIRAAKAEE